MTTVEMEFEAAVKAAPESVRSRVSIFTSTGNCKTGEWTLRDADGKELWKSHHEQKPAKAATKARQTLRLPRGAYITKVMVGG